MIEGCHCGIWAPNCDIVSATLCLLHNHIYAFLLAYYTTQSTGITTQDSLLSHFYAVEDVQWIFFSINSSYETLKPE